MYKALRLTTMKHGVPAPHNEDRLSKSLYISIPFWLIF